MSKELHFVTGYPGESLLPSSVPAHEKPKVIHWCTPALLSILTEKSLLFYSFGGDAGPAGALALLTSLPLSEKFEQKDEVATTMCWQPANSIRNFCVATSSRSLLFGEADIVSTFPAGTTSCDGLIAFEPQSAKFEGAQSIALPEAKRRVCVSGHLHLDTELGSIVGNLATTRTVILGATQCGMVAVFSWSTSSLLRKVTLSPPVTKGPKSESVPTSSLKVLQCLVSLRLRSAAFLLSNHQILLVRTSKRKQLDFSTPELEFVDICVGKTKSAVFMSINVKHRMIATLGSAGLESLQVFQIPPSHENEVVVQRLSGPIIDGINFEDVACLSLSRSASQFLPTNYAPTALEWSPNEELLSVAFSSPSGSLQQQTTSAATSGMSRVVLIHVSGTVVWDSKVYSSGCCPLFSPHSINYPVWHPSMSALTVISTSESTPEGSLFSFPLSFVTMSPQSGVPLRVDPVAGVLSMAIGSSAPFSTGSSTEEKFSRSNSQQAWGLGGEDTNPFVVLGGVNNGWGPCVMVPPEYLSINRPLKGACTSFDGQMLACYGKQGAAIYNVRRKKWRLFGSSVQESAVQCVADPFWIHNWVVGLPVASKENLFAVTFYPRYHLDNASLLESIPLLSKPVRVMASPIRKCTSLVKAMDSNANAGSPLSVEEEVMKMKTSKANNEETVSCHPDDSQWMILVLDAADCLRTFVVDLVITGAPAATIEPTKVTLHINPFRTVDLHQLSLDDRLCSPLSVAFVATAATDDLNVGPVSKQRKTSKAPKTASTATPSITITFFIHSNVDNALYAVGGQQQHCTATVYKVFDRVVQWWLDDFQSTSFVNDQGSLVLYCTPSGLHSVPWRDVSAAITTATTISQPRPSLTFTSICGSDCQKFPMGSASGMAVYVGSAVDPVLRHPSLYPTYLLCLTPVLLEHCFLLPLFLNEVNPGTMAWLQHKATQLRCEGTFVDTFDFLIHALVHDEFPVVHRYLNHHVDPSALDDVTATSPENHAKTKPKEDAKVSTEAAWTFDTRLDVLQRVCTFLRNYPEFHGILVRCIRKADVDHWGLLFALVGTPHDFFDECLAANELLHAVGMVRCLMLERPANVHWSLDRSTLATRQVLPLVLRRGQFDVAYELLRFLSMLAAAAQEEDNARGVTLLPPAKQASGASSDDVAGGGPLGLLHRILLSVGLAATPAGVTAVPAAHALPRREPKQPSSPYSGSSGIRAWEGAGTRAKAMHETLLQHEALPALLEEAALDLLRCGKVVQLCSLFETYDLDLTYFIKHKYATQFAPFSSSNSSPVDLGGIFDMLHCELGLPRCLSGEINLPPSFTNCIPEQFVKEAPTLLRNSLSLVTATQEYLIRCQSARQAVVALRSFFTHTESLEYQLLLAIILIDVDFVVSTCGTNPELRKKILPIFQLKPVNRGYHRLWKLLEQQK